MATLDRPGGSGSPSETIEQLRYCSAHVDLRHEFGSQLLEAGGDLHEVQATLGHTNIKMTSTYLNATTQGVKQTFKKLEAKRRRQSIKVVRSPQMARG